MAQVAEEEMARHESDALEADEWNGCTGDYFSYYVRRQGSVDAIFRQYEPSSAEVFTAQDPQWRDLPSVAEDLTNFRDSYRQIRQAQARKMKKRLAPSA